MLRRPLEPKLEAREAGREVGEQAMDTAVTYFSGKAILKTKT